MLIGTPLGVVQDDEAPASHLAASYIRAALYARSNRGRGHVTICVGGLFYNCGAEDTVGQLAARGWYYLAEAARARRDPRRLPGHTPAEPRYYPRLYPRYSPYPMEGE